MKTRDRGSEFRSGDEARRASHATRPRPDASARSCAFKQEWRALPRHRPSEGTFLGHWLRGPQPPRSPSSFRPVFSFALARPSSGRRADAPPAGAAPAPRSDWLNARHENGSPRSKRANTAILRWPNSASVLDRRPSGRLRIGLQPSINRHFETSGCVQLPQPDVSARDKRCLSITEWRDDGSASLRGDATCTPHWPSPGPCFRWPGSTTGRKSTLRERQA
jgi:hypothetical protein